MVQRTESLFSQDAPVVKNTGWQIESALVVSRTHCPTAEPPWPLYGQAHNLATTKAQSAVAVSSWTRIQDYGLKMF